MSDQPKIKCLCAFGFCLGPGRGDVNPGDKIELDPYNYRIESDLGRVIDLPWDDPDCQPGALQQAHIELLEQIAMAPDLETLDRLLSEDPEIAAAYEKRVMDLELLGRIANAASDVELEPLLSEVPKDNQEIMAAFEQRRKELDEPDH